MPICHACPHFASSPRLASPAYVSPPLFPRPLFFRELFMIPPINHKSSCPIVWAMDEHSKRVRHCRRNNLPIFQLVDLVFYIGFARIEITLTGEGPCSVGCIFLYPNCCTSSIVGAHGLSLTCASIALEKSLDAILPSILQFHPWRRRSSPSSFASIPP